MIVSAQSEVEKLSSRQVANLYGKRCVLPQWGACSADGYACRHRVARNFTAESYTEMLSSCALLVAAGWRRVSGNRHEGGGQCRYEKLIADNPNTIGYITRSAVDASVRVVNVP